MKKIFISSIIILLSQTFSAKAQITSDDKKLLKHYEDSLKILNNTIIDDPDFGTRKNACYDFIKMLVKAIKVDHSFDYPFDSLTRITILYPEDHSFRIFNWVLPYEEGEFRYYGVIQKNNPEKTEAYPLYDYSDLMTHPEDSILTTEHWYGCLYYNMIKETAGSKIYYTLFGWDGNNMRSNKKVIDILSFDSEGKPQFGAPLFDFGKIETDYKNSINRFIIEYKEDAGVSVNYDPIEQKIIFDHLQPETPSTKGLYYTYVPDGTYEGFEWKNGKWIYISNVFTSTQKEPPFPDPIDFDKKNKGVVPKQ